MTSNKSKKRILVAEDNDSILYNLKLSLEMNGFEVLTASNGKEVIEILEKNDKLPHLILSDIMMPVLDGYQLYEFVSKNELLKNISFIFISAKSSPNDVKFGKSLGIDDYITKPINEDLLLSIIRKKLLQ